jgi:hypothetical protein
MDRVPHATMPLLCRNNALAAESTRTSIEVSTGHDNNEVFMSHADRINQGEVFRMGKHIPKSLASKLLPRKFINAIEPSSDHERSLNISFYIGIHKPSSLVIALRTTELSSLTFQALGLQVIELCGQRLLVAPDGHEIEPLPALRFKCGIVKVCDLLGPLATVIHTEDKLAEGVSFHFHQDPRINATMTVEISEEAFMREADISRWSPSDFH